TDPGAAGRQAPCRRVRTWSRPPGTIPQHRDSAVAGRGFRQASIGPPAPDARSDTSSENRGMPVRRANSPYARRSRRPCRIRPVAKPTVATSQVGGRRESWEPRALLAVAVAAAVATEPPPGARAPARQRPRRPPKAAQPLAAAVNY